MTEESKCNKTNFTPPPPSFNKGVGSNYDNTEFFVVLDHFSPFLSTNNPENKNFEKI